MKTQSAFLLLILAQAAHSIEEYVFHLFDVLAPARFLSELISADLAFGFAVLNIALVGFGLWCWLYPARRGWPSARPIMWAWCALELANGIGHLLLALSVRGYFPGLATAPLLLIAAIATAIPLRRRPS
jgi:hypothetical protein